MLHLICCVSPHACREGILLWPGGRSGRIRVEGVEGFRQKKCEKDRGVTILYLGQSHCKPDLERKLNSVLWAKLIFWDIPLPALQRKYCKLLVLRCFHICYSPYSKFPLCLNLCAYQATDIKKKNVNHCWNIWI